MKLQYQASSCPMTQILNFLEMHVVKRLRDRGINLTAFELFKGRQMYSGATDVNAARVRCTAIELIWKVVCQDFFFSLIPPASLDDFYWIRISRALLELFALLQKLLMSQIILVIFSEIKLVNKLVTLPGKVIQEPSIECVYLQLLPDCSIFCMTHFRTQWYIFLHHSCQMSMSICNTACRCLMRQDLFFEMNLLQK